MRGRVGFSVYPDHWHELALELRRRAGVIRVAKIRVRRVAWKLVQRDGCGKFSAWIAAWAEYCARECEPLAREKRRRSLVGSNKRVVGCCPRLGDL